MKRLALCYAALGLPLFIACSDNSQPMDSATSRPDLNTIATQNTVGGATVSSTGQPIGHVMTLPNASCIVRPTGQSTPTGQFLADAKGVARFNAPASRWGTQLLSRLHDPTPGSKPAKWISHRPPRSGR